MFIIRCKRVKKGEKVLRTRHNTLVDSFLILLKTIIFQQPANVMEHKHITLLQCRTFFLNPTHGDYMGHKLLTEYIQ